MMMNTLLDVLFADED